MATTTRAHVVISNELMTEIDRLVGKRKRSQFISEAVAARLVNLRQRAAAAAVIAELGAGKPGGPPEWETAESTRRWLEELRESEAARERRLDEAWKDPGGGTPPS